MSEIGLRSGKIRAGLYKCGEYHIERQSSDYWHVKKFYNSDAEVVVSQHKTFTEAYIKARYGH